MNSGFSKLCIIYLFCKTAKKMLDVFTIFTCQLHKFWHCCLFSLYRLCKQLSYRYEKHPSIAVMLCTKSERCFFDIPCHSFLKCCLSALSVCCHKPLMPTEIPLFIVQMKTRDTPCQKDSGAFSTIPKVTTSVTSQPTLHSTQIKIDGTSVFQFGHFHSLQNGDTVLTSSGQMFLL